MADKKTEKTSKKRLPSLKSFVDGINKADARRNGIGIRYAFTKRKRLVKRSKSNVLSK